MSEPKKELLSSVLGLLCHLPFSLLSGAGQQPPMLVDVEREPVPALVRDVPVEPLPWQLGFKEEFSPQLPLIEAPWEGFGAGQFDQFRHPQELVLLPISSNFNQVR